MAKSQTWPPINKETMVIFSTAVNKISIRNNDLNLGIVVKEGAKKMCAIVGGVSSFFA